MSAEYSPSEPLGPGRTVIEASAGTGKTYTIAALVAHLVAAEGVPIERILVITFTRAATAELRGRVRRRLVETRIAALTHAERDEHMASLFAVTDAGVVTGRVSKALSSFDRAQILTIHGFGQRLLSALGFGSRLPANLEPVALDARLLSLAATDLVVGKWAMAADDPGRLKPSDVRAIGWEVASKPDARIVPEVAEVVNGRAQARVEMADTMRNEVERRLRRSGQVSFDDSLMELAAVLEDPAVGEAAGALLSDRYEIGLVDEAQDTDPMQWKVIRAMFESSRLVVIGDPKQSIYRFRGADIDAYLDAAREARPRTLGTNWRSDARLLDALDALFGDFTFGDKAIAYQPVEPAPGHVDARIDGVSAAMTIRWLGAGLPIERRKNIEGLFLVEPARRAVAGDVAAHIVELLESGVNIVGRQLQPSDLAVLCRTSRQVDMVRTELDRRRVPSVSGRSGAVFCSEAAEEWRRFLMAVEHPERMDRVRLGATSLLMGMTIHQVAALDDESEVALQQRMRELQRILHEAGVPRLVAEVERDTRLTWRVLSRPDGERIMTDVTHVAEEMHNAWRPARMGSLVAWLEDAIRESKQRANDGTEEPEARQRRLETDAEAVQVLTIHGAKGLEFPVVLVPYGWDHWEREPDIPVLHDANAGGRIIDVAGKKGWPGFDGNAKASRDEEVAEESRLLYVALTRARHHLVVWWVKSVNGADSSTLGRLLGAESWKTAARNAAPGVIDKQEVHDLAPVRPYQGTHRSEEQLTAARFERRLDHLWRRASFSSLAPGHSVSDEHAELKADDEITIDEETPLPPDLLMADLPKGARFGTLVHEIFESVVFDDPDLEVSMRTVLAEAMERSGWDFDPDVFVSGMLAAMNTPLGPLPTDPVLTGVGRVLKELIFELPVRTADGPVSLADLGAVMTTHLASDDPFRIYAARLGEVDQQQFRGFLTGAIDLTLALDDRRWVVMDYKSNALPDYGPAAITSAMIEGNYVLQSTLYQVALHRYLSWRLPGYDPAINLGGSIYLFLRGAVGPATPVSHGARQGVNRWTPPPVMIEAISRLFEGGQL